MERKYGFIAIAHKTNGATKQYRSVKTVEEARKLISEMTDYGAEEFVVKKVEVTTTYDEEGYWVKTERIESLVD